MQHRKISRPANKLGSSAACYFRALELTNVRCFGAKPQSLTLCDGLGRPAQWTVLLGNNGTGKSSILECLAGFGVSLGAASGAARFVAEPHFKSGQRPFPARNSQANAGMATVEAQFQLDVPLTARTGGRSARERFQIGDVALPALPEPIDSRPWCLGYGVDRRMSGGSLHRDDLDDPTTSLYSTRAVLRNAEEWVLQTDYRAAREPTPENLARARQVTQLLKMILPDVSAVRIGKSASPRPSPLVEFKTPDGWLPLRWLGHGYLTMIAWVVDFASRLFEHYPDRKDPLAGPAVCLVDEIDLHLHPRWQRKLIPYLSKRFKNTQFIVTAHSPIFVQAASDMNLVVLRRDKRRRCVVIDNTPEQIRGWRIDQVMTSNLFEIDSARPPQIAKLVGERKRLLSKPQMTKHDRDSVKRLEQQIGPLPGAESAQDVRTMSLLRESIAQLKRSRKL